MTPTKPRLTAVATLLAAVAPALAQTWISPSDGFWSNPANWTSLPVSGPTTQLLFSNSRGTAYTATNDLGNPFVLNALIANNELTAANTAFSGAVIVANAAGSSLQFAGTNAAFTQNGPGNLLVTGTTLDLSVPVTFDGPGVGSAMINSQITGVGSVTVNRSGYVPGLLSVFFGNAATANTFAGGVNLQGGSLAVAGPNGLGTGAVTVTTAGVGLLAAGDLRATQPGVVLPNNVVIAPGATFNLVTGNALALAGPITGPGGVNLGNTLQPYTATFTAANNYNGGTTLTSAALTLSGGGTIAPATSATNALSLFHGSALTLSNTAAALAARLGGANVTVAMNRADFNFLGNAGTATGQTIATLDGRGQNVIRVTPAAGGAQVAVGNYTRVDRGTLFAGVAGAGATLGGAPGANVANVAIGAINGQPAANFLAGGGGPAGSPTVSIIPFFTADTTPGGNGNSFVTVDANGLRPLNVATEYAAALPLAAYQTNPAANLRLTQATGGLTVPTTVNALAVAGTGGGVFNAGNSTAALAVASGAVLVSNGAAHVATAGLDFGTREGVITSATTPVLVSSAVTGSNGMTVSSGPTGANVETRLLNPANAFSGTVTVDNGVLSFLDDAALGNAANGVTLSGGSLRYMGFAGTSARPIAVTAAGGSVQVSPNTLSLFPGSVSQGAVLTLTGPITGTGPLHFNDDGVTAVTGSGEIRLQGNASGYSGTPFVTGGILGFDSDARLGTGNRLVLNGGTLHASGPAVVIPRTVEMASTSFVRTDAGEGLTFTGPVRAGPTAAGLVKLGAGSLAVRNTSTLGGSTAVGLFAPLTAISTEFVPGGDVTLADAGALTNTSSVTVAQGSRLILDNGAVNLANRVNSVALTLAGGGLRMTGNAAGATSEAFGPLVLPTDLGAAIDLAPAGGHTLTASFSNGPTVANPLARAAGATLVINAPNLGTQSVVRFLSAAVPPTLSGNVLPGVFGVDGGTPSMVTAPTAAGVASVRPLTAGEHTPSFAGAAATADVRPAAAETVGTQTVNSVNLAGGATATVPAGATLTIASGNLIVTPSATLAGTGTVTGGNADGLHVYAAGTAADIITLGPTVGGTRLNKTGPAVLAIQSIDPALTTMNVHAGTLRLPAGGAVASIPILNVQAGATFDTAGGNFDVGRLGGLGTVDTGAGVLTVTPIGAAGAFGGTLAGTGGLVKAGPGTLTLTPSASVPGPINVFGGTLIVGNTLAPFILVPQFAGAAVTLADGTTLQLNAVRDVSRPINAGNATLDFVSGNSQPSSTVSGTVTLDAGKTLAVSGSSNGQVRLAGLVTGPGTLNLNSGNFVLTGANDYTGGTTVTTTALVSIANDAAFGNAAGPVTLAGSGVSLAAQGGSRTLPNPFALSADFQTVGVGRLTYAGDSTLGGTGTTRAVTVNSSGGLSLRNLDGPAGLQLAKAGGGTLVLDGTSPYAGTTAVAAGTLLVPAGASKTGTGAVAVGSNAAGAALATLAGSGSLAGPVTVNASGIVAPGDSPGTLTFTGGLAMVANATYLWELSANTTAGPGTFWDRINLTGGDLALDTAARFVPSFTGTATTPNPADPFWQAGHTWQNVIDLTGAATNLGGNASLMIDNSFWVSAGTFTTQANRLSVMLVWTPVPEPVHVLAFGTVALAIGRATRRTARRRPGGV